MNKSKKTELEKIKEAYAKELNRKDKIIDELKKEKLLILKTALERSRRLVNLERRLEPIQKKLKKE